MVQSQHLEEKVAQRVDGADRSTATVRTASRMARRMAGGRASINDIRASFQPVRGLGEGQADGSKPIEFICHENETFLQLLVGRVGKRRRSA